MPNPSPYLDKEIIGQLIEVRHHLHAHPELSGAEDNTAAFVADQLRKLNSCSVLTDVGGNGVVAVFDSGQKGPVIALRAELDALPIQETNDFEYRSKKGKVSHKCGHDGHMTILLGVAKWLSDNAPQNGKAVLIFQPAEENGEGAKAVLSDPQFAPHRPDFIYALHNLPGLPAHDIFLKAGNFTPYVKSVIIKLKGKTAHAAEPEHAINPAAAMAEIIISANTLSNNQPEADDFSVVVPVHATLGEKAYGITPGYAEVHFTLRTWTKEKMANVEQPLLQKVKQIVEQHKLGCDLEFTQIFFPNENNETAVGHIHTAAERAGYKINVLDTPFKWGEDFGLFTQSFKGAIFGLGAGENQPALHNPDYDFPDELITTGCAVFIEILKDHLFNV